MSKGLTKTVRTGGLIRTSVIVMELRGALRTLRTLVTSGLRPGAPIPLRSPAPARRNDDERLHFLPKEYGD